MKTSLVTVSASLVENRGGESAFIRNQPCINTRKDYASEIKLFYRDIGKRAVDVTLEDLLDYRESMEARELKPATIAKKLVILRRLFSFLHEQGFLASNPTAGLKLPKVNDETTREILTLAECNQLLASIGKETQRDLRDRAIISLMLINGLRVIEIARATAGDLVQKDGYIVMKVRGKGRNADTRIREDVDEAIKVYLQTRGNVLPTDALFVGTNHRATRRMAKRSIQYMIERRMKAIGVDRPNIVSHSLRHSSITHLINAGASLTAAQDFARHKNPQTTQRYYHNLERIKNHATMMHPVRIA